MTKVQKSLSLALALSLVMAVFPYHPTAKNMLFSGFSLGWSSKLDNDKEQRVELLEDDTEIVYSFKITEWLMKLFE